MSQESLKKRPIISDDVKVLGMLGGMLCAGVGANVALYQSNTNRAIQRASYLISECAPAIADEPVGDVRSENNQSMGSALRVGELINNQSDFDTVVPRLSVEELARAAHVLKARVQVNNDWGIPVMLLEGINKELAKECTSEQSSKNSINYRHGKQK